ncbi:hypothetical protein ON010_g9840 [Phytophthora cinnamomi]|nr:hypothetical protein ON010_g9840 [Phytophthora cinnamomi]
MSETVAATAAPVAASSRSVSCAFRRSPAPSGLPASWGCAFPWWEWATWLLPDRLSRRPPSPFIPAAARRTSALAQASHSRHKHSLRFAGVLTSPFSPGPDGRTAGRYGRQKTRRAATGAGAVCAGGRDGAGHHQLHGGHDVLGRHRQLVRLDHDGDNDSHACHDDQDAYYDDQDAHDDHQDPDGNDGGPDCHHRDADNHDRGAHGHDRRPLSHDGDPLGHDGGTDNHRDQFHDGINRHSVVRCAGLVLHHVRVRHGGAQQPPAAP